MTGTEMDRLGAYPMSKPAPQTSPYRTPNYKERYDKFDRLPQYLKDRIRYSPVEIDWWPNGSEARILNYINAQERLWEAIWNQRRAQQHTELSHRISSQGSQSQTLGQLNALRRYYAGLSGSPSEPSQDMPSPVDGQ